MPTWQPRANDMAMTWRGDVAGRCAALTPPRTRNGLGKREETHGRGAGWGIRVWLGWEETL